MKLVNTLALSVAAALALGLVAYAADKDKDKDAPKEVTLKGTITCGKCDLKKSDECATVIKVKDGDKETIYWLVDKGNAEKYHEKCCPSAQKGAVTGVVGEDKDKKRMTITPSKDGVKYD
jgi:hypothetical protein